MNDTPTDPADYIIEPLVDDWRKLPPREDKRCNCNLCRHWFPLIRNLELQLDSRGKELLDELVEQWISVDENRAYAESKLNGSWPGWEDLKDYDPMTHKVVRLTEEEKKERKERQLWEE